MSRLPAIVVTGCSSGIGRATARRLAHRGLNVYATARDVAALDDLADAGCTALQLDVTDERSMTDAVNAVLEQEEAVGILINNAGYSQYGAIESVPLEKIRRQFETNVFGLTRMCQLVLPGMRAQGWGRIVNVSSMAGRLTFPGGGVYHATKHAVESISDALRFEVAGYGIDVVVIQPGIIRTQFADVASRSVEGVGLDGAPYEEFNSAVVRATQRANETGLFSRLGGEAEDVARVIERAILSTKPRPRYAVTPSARILMLGRRVAPDRLWDWMLSTRFPRPR